MSSPALFPPEITDLATQLLDACRKGGIMLSTAESCTGGLIASALTEIAGSSDVVERGFVTYSNEAKNEMLGVPAMMIETHGAVSEPVARAMAEGAVAHSRSQLAIAVTGVAGPGGGSAQKPVGLVHVAVAREGSDTRHLECRFGDIGREAVRFQTVKEALRLALDAA